MGQAEGGRGASGSQAGVLLDGEVAVGVEGVDVLPGGLAPPAVTPQWEERVGVPGGPAGGRERAESGTRGW